MNGRGQECGGMNERGRERSVTNEREGRTNGRGQGRDGMNGRGRGHGDGWDKQEKWDEWKRVGKGGTAACMG